MPTPGDLSSEKTPAAARPADFISDEELKKLVNFELNDSELVMSRVQHPVIRKQLLDLLYEGEWQSFLQEYALVQNPGGGYVLDQEAVKKRIEEDNARPPHVRAESLRETTSKYERFSNRVVTAEEIRANIKTYERFEQELKQQIANSETAVKISSGTSAPDMSSISLNWVRPDGKKPSEKEWSMYIAHEKGHHLRPYIWGFFHSHFRRGFDLTRVIYSPAEYERDVQFLLSADEDKSREEIVQVFTHEKLRERFLGHVFSGYEIAERMAQLKNYFGMKVEERFTKWHLEYARRNYIKDLDSDNHMTEFFQAITPETTEAFIEIINSSGV